LETSVIHYAVSGIAALSRTRPPTAKADHRVADLIVHPPHFHEIAYRMVGVRAVIFPYLGRRAA
jgi:hypothetical protein